MFIKFAKTLYVKQRLGRMLNQSREMVLAGIITHEEHKINEIISKMVMGAYQTAREVNWAHALDDLQIMLVMSNMSIFKHIAQDNKEAAVGQILVVLEYWAKKHIPNYMELTGQFMQAVELANEFMDAE